MLIKIRLDFRTLEICVRGEIGRDIPADYTTISRNMIAVADPI
jgi:hypothetical protein